MLTWLDRIPLSVLIVIAAWLAVAPLVPEPHLVEKLRMLWQGTLRRPIDLFDLLFHLAPLALLGWRVQRIWAAKQTDNTQPPH